MSKFIPVDPEKWAEMVQAQAENARLKAEVERVGEDNAHLHKGIYSLSLNVAQLKDEVERLTKAGDELHAFLIGYIVERRISSSYLNKLDDDWNAAKEGKGQP
jgi:predicted nuclease with TOPRIM domain